MAEKEQTLGLAAKKAEIAEWYPEVVLKAELADYSPVKGCMVIRPNGYAIWEAIQREFDATLKSIGVENAYFPLFIPESFFKKEAEHAEGFKPEVAWIANTEEGERLAIRPTSETIMYDMYSKWIRSHRDLPLRINQWCNVVRWETKATKLFLRTREFLWQEGHCAYETKEECDKEVKLIIDKYEEVCREVLAFPVIKGTKTDYEKFAGADYTLSIEAFMPDGKGLQAGTSHALGTRFAKAFGISFLGKDKQPHEPWQSSWGITTRLIGAAIMIHGDDKGAVIPPRAAKNQVVIVPIIFDDSKEEVLKAAREMEEGMKAKGIRVILDDSEKNPGWKFNEWELKGVPLRVEIGPKDLAKGQAVLVRRHDGKKNPVSIEDAPQAAKVELEVIQHDMYTRAKAALDASIVKAVTKEELLKGIQDKKLVLAPFCCESAIEKEIKEQADGATTRNIPFDAPKINDEKCVWTGKPAKAWVYFAKSY